MTVITMQDKQMVDQVKAAYNNAPKWTSRVDSMSKQQVQAVYFRLKKEGRVC